MSDDPTPEVPPPEREVGDQTDPDAVRFFASSGIGLRADFIYFQPIGGIAE